MQSFTGLSSEIADGYIAIGHIGSLFGVKGEVKVTPATDFPERFRALKTVYLGPDARPIQLVSSRPHQNALLVRFAGYTTREEAQALVGLWVQIPAADVLPLAEGERYIFQLIGLKVRTTDGRDLGVVDEVLSTPANEVLVTHGPLGELLIPYINDVIAEENPHSDEIVVYPIPGLLE